MNDLKPLNDNVLIELNELKEQKTASGLIMPESAKNDELTGKVAAIAKIDGAEIAPGDTVLYNRNAGHKIEHSGAKYIMLPYADIIAKIVETEAI